MKYEGKIYSSNRFGDVVVLEYINGGRALIQFLNTGYIVEEAWSSIRSGYIKDRSIPSTCGFGFIDVEGASIGKIMTKEYRLWHNMLNRCYNEKSLMNNPTYANCNVDDKWKYLSAFKEWCNEQIGFEQDGWHLDKDLLLKGNKTYSPDNCCFVPHDINTFLTNGKSYRGDLPVGVILDKGAKTPRYRARLSKFGKYHCYGSYSNPTDAFYAYKKAKEDFAKELANIWKDKIDPRAYEALINWTVEITD